MALNDFDHFTMFHIFLFSVFPVFFFLICVKLLYKRYDILLACQISSEIEKIINRESLLSTLYSLWFGFRKLSFFQNAPTWKFKNKQKKKMRESARGKQT